LKRPPARERQARVEPNGRNRLPVHICGRLESSPCAGDRKRRQALWDAPQGTGSSRGGGMVNPDQRDVGCRPVRPSNTTRRQHLIVGEDATGFIVSPSCADQDLSKQGDRTKSRWCGCGKAPRWHPPQGGVELSLQLPWRRRIGYPVLISTPARRHGSIRTRKTALTTQADAASGLMTRLAKSVSSSSVRFSSSRISSRMRKSSFRLSCLAQVASVP
jgi:hypothetical protein